MTTYCPFRGFWSSCHFCWGAFDHFVIFESRGFWSRGFWYTLYECDCIEKAVTLREASKAKEYINEDKVRIDLTNLFLWLIVRRLKWAKIQEYELFNVASDGEDDRRRRKELSLSSRKLKIQITLTSMLVLHSSRRGTERSTVAVNFSIFFRINVVKEYTYNYFPVDHIIIKRTYGILAMFS